jgi:hypothetical protein
LLYNTCEQSGVLLLLLEKHEPSTSSQNKLLSHSDAAVRAKLCALKQVSQTVLLEGCNDSSSLVRQQAFRNVRLPMWRLQQAIFDPREAILAVKNPLLTAKDLQSLLKYNDLSLLQQLIRHPGLDTVVFRQLVKQYGSKLWRELRAHRLMTPQLTIQLLEQAPQDKDLKHNIATSTMLNIAIEKKLLDDPFDLTTMIALADNPVTSIETQIDLLQMGDRDVRLKLLSKKILLPEIVQFVLTQAEPDIVNLLIAQGRLGEEALIDLLNKAPANYDLERLLLAGARISLKTLNALSQSSFPGIRLNLVQHPKANASLMAKLADDPEWRVREAIAKRLKDLPAFKAYFEKDPHPAVRYAANPKSLNLWQRWLLKRSK